MSRKRVVLLAGAVVALVGLVLLRPRMFPRQESFYRSEIWLPQAAMSEAPGPLPPWEGPIPGDRVSLEKALARTLFPIPLPSYMPEGAVLREVYVSSTDDPPLYRQAALVYENGVYIILRYGGMAWSWESPYRERPEGFKTVEVNGHAGVGADPRPERICVSYAPSTEFECRDGAGLRPGVVEWQTDGLVTAIYSYDYSLAELLRVAESMDVG
ncbi:MAG TPA: hypothetical protein VJ714_10220 [Anaerolineae bacterium]|jgi:hypothetical protein|nr:hypothetical protein [Anaerolineae bacterium]